MNIWQRFKSSSRYIRLTQWEYWPAKLFYWPMYFYIPWLQLKSLNLVFFTATNPGLDTGGIGLESKYDTLQKLPQELCPKTILFKRGDNLKQLGQLLNDHQIHYPLIAKPDLGYRGFLVKKINSEKDLHQLLSKYQLDFIIQELVDEMEEFGVFYIRNPHEATGKVTSLTLKNFLHVTGDGQSTIQRLMEQKPRALLQLPVWKETQPELLKTIPSNGTRVPLGIIGNHSKGTHFINGEELIDQELVQTFDRISKRIEGFYYGRYDIKCPSLEDLKQGKNIIIIELNGTCSEPTHIYDANKMTYLGAVWEIIRYWQTIYKISVANRKQGIPFQSQREIGRRFLDLRQYFIAVERMENE